MPARGLTTMKCVDIDGRVARVSCLQHPPLKRREGRQASRRWGATWQRPVLAYCKRCGLCPCPGGPEEARGLSSR